MARRVAASCLALCFGLCLVLLTRRATADRVAMVPSRSATDPAAASALDVEMLRALAALGHGLVPEQETRAAMAAVADGVADTPEEYRAVAAGTKAHWVVAASVEPSVVTMRVEIAAHLASMGRTETVARDVERSRSQEQVREMLAVLVRPEGVGASELPWERAVPPPAPPSPAPAVRGVGAQPFEAAPKAAPEQPPRPYAEGHPWFVAGALGFSVPVSRPDPAEGSGAALIGSLRAGRHLAYGIEAFLEVGGNLAGPAALWPEAGLRWMLTPPFARGALHLGPEVFGGPFVRLAGRGVTAPDGTVLESKTSVHPTLGGTLAVAVTPASWLAVEAGLGDLRWASLTEGGIVLLGARAGAAIRF